MKTLTIALCALSCVVPAFSPLLSQASVPEWKKIDGNERFELFEKEIPDSPLVVFRGDGLLDSPLAQVAAVLLDQKRSLEWMDHLRQRKTLRWINPREYVEYTHVEAPLIIKDRDFVAQVTLEIHPEKKSFVIRSHSVDDATAPETVGVRGQILSTIFTLTSVESGIKTRISAEIQVDPKGAIPKWIVNLFQRNWPKKTFYAVQDQLKKEDLREPEAFREVLRELSKI